MSGMKLNASKSELFSSGISTEDLQQIKDVSGFKTGTLPVRYLGIPLLTKKPAVKDFDSLLKKMRRKVES